MERAKPRQRMEATAAALELVGESVPWDRSAAYDDQIAAAERAVQALSPGLRAEFDAQLPIANVMLHRRVPLAFKIRGQVSETEFERLRTGVHSGFGFEHYLDVVTEARLLKAFRNSLMLAFTTCILTTALAFARRTGSTAAAFRCPASCATRVSCPWCPRRC